MSRRALIAVSAIAHVCLFAGVFVSGVWRLERLDGGRAQVRLTQPLSLPDAAAGGRSPSNPAAPPPKDPPRLPAKRRHQPAQRPEPPAETPAVQTASSDAADGGAGQGSGSGAATGTGCTVDCDAPAEPVCGNGSLESGEGCDDGNLLGGDGCSASCRVEPRRPPPTAVVAPSALAALRRSGETQVHPGDRTQRQMVLDNVHRVEAILKVCVTADGSVGRSQLLRSTGYDAYDAALLTAVRDWRYEPYRVNGAPVPACSTVRFVYTLQ